jgi:hypothetical protein
MRSWRDDEAIGEWEASRQETPARGPEAVPEPPNAPPRVFGGTDPERPQHGTDQPDTARSPK